MSPVAYALSEIRHRIPLEMLSLVFKPQYRQWTQKHASMESIIRDKVIESRIRPACNAVGAMMVEISLQGAEQEVISPNVSIFRIPKALTQGRVITSALAVSYGQRQQIMPYNQGSQLVNAANAMMNSNSPIQVSQTASLTIIGENVVMVEDYLPIGDRLTLRCLLEHDGEFSNIKPQSAIEFSELCVLATKAFIYNSYIFELGNGALSGGQDLDVVKDVMDNYRDADELYLTYLRETWHRVSHMNDPRRVQRSLRALVGGNP